MNSLSESLGSVHGTGWPAAKSLYVHVPFCRHRCGYCNFSVVAGRDDLQDRFLDCLEIELGTQLGGLKSKTDVVDRVKDPIAKGSLTRSTTEALLELRGALGEREERPRLDTIFVGGGTPTHLSLDRIKRLGQLIADHAELTATTEFSVEANPEDITEPVLRCLRSIGVNRISMGVQSFDQAKLACLERSHSRSAAIKAIETACEIIGNVSIDLIFAAPGETLDVWDADLETATGLPISHLSTYCLTFEKGTSFWTKQLKGTLAGVDEDTEVDMYEMARTKLADAGMEHYEISSFAKPGKRCRHNEAYWDGKSWFAVGPGAARFIDGGRAVNHRSTTTYLKRIQSGVDATEEREVISPLQHARELAAFGIRKIDGIDLSTIRKRTGVNVASMFANSIRELIDQEWVQASGDWLRLTHGGVLFADAVASRFLTDEMN